MSVAPDKSLESWIWDAAFSIRGAKDAGKYKDYILPLIFTKRLCDVFDDEVNRIAEEVGGRAKAFKLVKHDKKLVRFYLPLEPKLTDDPVWSVIRTLADKVGEKLTTHLRAIADANPLLKGILDRVDFNATTHGTRDLDDDRFSALIEAISAKRLGLRDVEPDIIGRSYEYLIRKFAEGAGRSGGEQYTPAEVGFVIARIMEPETGMDAYDPTCGSAGLLIKLDLVLRERMAAKRKVPSPSGRGAGDEGAKHASLKLHGQEYEPSSWAMANMNMIMIIHDLEGRIEIGNTFKNPKFRAGNRLQTFDRVGANPMWNQDWFKEQDYEADPFDRFPKGAGFPGNKADWGWMQHILASLKPLLQFAAGCGASGEKVARFCKLRHNGWESGAIPQVITDKALFCGAIPKIAPQMELKWRNYPESRHFPAHASAHLHRATQRRGARRPAPSPRGGRGRNPADAALRAPAPHLAALARDSHPSAPDRVGRRGPRPALPCVRPRHATGRRPALGGDATGSPDREPRAPHSSLQSRA